MKLPSSFLGALIFLLAASTTYSLLIGAFNVQIFGTKKSNNQTIMDVIIRIIKKYDIILIQEIRDNTDYTITNLMKRLNTPGSNVIFTNTISERLGSTSSKEQYSFLIRSNSGISVSDKHQYPNNKKFERPPFSIRVRSTNTAGIKDFILMAIHTKPDDAVDEIGNLTNAWNVVKKKWNTDNILIMGDLNAGCSYASKTALNRLDIRKNPPYNWLIPDSAVTTVKSKCPYDRFIMSGTKLLHGLVKNSAKVFHYDREFKISSDLTAAVSDHYPIELQIKSFGTQVALGYHNDSAASKLNFSFEAFTVVCYVCIWRLT